MKKIFVIILLFAAFGLNAQWVNNSATGSVGVNYYQNGTSLTYSVVLDSTSNKTYTSDYIDWTLFDGQTVYMTYSLVQDHWNYGAGNDTVTLINLGKDGLGNVIGMDTNKIVSGLTQAAASTQVKLTPTGYAPRTALYITPTVTGATTRRNGKLAVLKVTIYSPTMDIIAPRNQMNW